MQLEVHPGGGGIMLVPGYGPVVVSVTPRRSVTITLVTQLEVHPGGGKIVDVPGTGP